MWDWRDGVERLEATSAEKDLAPLIASLEPGTRVVLVEPIVWTLNRWRAPWTKLIRIRSKEWSQALSNDPTHADHVDSADQLHAAAAEPGAGDGAT